MEPQMNTDEHRLESATRPSYGDVVHVDGDLVGRTSESTINCLVVAIRLNDDALLLLPERCPTKAQIASGSYMRWVKSGARYVPECQCTRTGERSHSQTVICTLCGNEINPGNMLWEQEDEEGTADGHG